MSHCFSGKQHIILLWNFLQILQSVSRNFFDIWLIRTWTQNRPFRKNIFCKQCLLSRECFKLDETQLFQEWCMKDFTGTLSLSMLTDKFARFHQQGWHSAHVWTNSFIAFRVWTTHFRAKLPRLMLGTEWTLCFVETWFSLYYFLCAIVKCLLKSKEI